MKRYMPAVLLLLWFENASASPPLMNPIETCEPAYAVLDTPVKVEVGASEFRLLVVGCKDRLASAWPPSMEKLEKALAVELREPHPVKILFLIRDRAPELRRRITNTVNEVLGARVVFDVFLYGARAAE